MQMAMIDAGVAVAGDPIETPVLRLLRRLL